MDSEAFRRVLGELSAEEIRATAHELRSRVRDDIGWWRSTLAVDRILRDAGRRRQAATAARTAADAIKAAAARAGLPPDDPDVLAVARAARQAARALLALEAGGSVLATLLDPWSRLASCIPDDTCWPEGLVV